MNKSENTTGLILIIIGVLFLINNFSEIEFSKYWPVILIVIGVYKIYKSNENNSQQ